MTDLRNKKPLVSIGIPTFNRADRNLLKVIERALGQTWENIEVIVSDNCSTDQTSTLVSAISDDRLRYFRQETNIGPNNNFNFCLQQARGEYFLLFHDDDMIDEDFIEACMSSLGDQQDVGAIFTGVRLIDENDNVLGEYQNRSSGTSSPEFVRAWFEGQVSLYLCNTLYNTQKLMEVGGFGSRKNLFDDLVPTFTLVARYGRSNVTEVKASFRRHMSNIGSSVPVQDWVEDSVHLLDVVCRNYSGDRQSLKRDGSLFFTRKMYQYIYTGQARSHSYLDYFHAYRMLGFRYSPVRFLVNKRVGPFVRKLKGG